MAFGLLFEESSSFFEGKHDCQGTVLQVHPRQLRGGARGGDARRADRARHGPDQGRVGGGQPVDRRREPPRRARPEGAEPAGRRGARVEQHVHQEQPVPSGQHPDRGTRKRELDHVRVRPGVLPGGAAGALPGAAHGRAQRAGVPGLQGLHRGGSQAHREPAPRGRAERGGRLRVISKGPGAIQAPQPRT